MHLEFFKQNLHCVSGFLTDKSFQLARKTSPWGFLRPLLDWWQVLAAAAVLVMLIWGIVRLVTKGSDDVDPSEADREMLRVLNDLLREGDVNHDEYRSIKGQLVSRLNTKWSSTPGSRSAAQSDQTSTQAAKTEVEQEQQCKPLSESSGTTQSEQTELSSNPTSVPKTLQNTGHLSSGSAPTVSENSVGTTEGESRSTKYE